VHKKCSGFAAADECEPQQCAGKNRVVKMSAATHYRVIFLGILVPLLLPTLLLAQGTLSISDASGAPGSTVNIPVTLVLNAGVQVDSLVFGLMITADAPAPALTGDLGFAQNASLPAPLLVCSIGTATAPCSGGAGPNSIAVSWLSSLSPPLSGTTALGFLTMTIPAGALVGQQYSLHVSGASGSGANGSNGGETSVSLTTADGTVTASSSSSSPLISLSQGLLQFTAQQGGANPANQTVTIANAGGGTLNWTASVASGSWLTVSPASGANSATITVAANITGINAGAYSGTIQVAASGATNSPQTINVTLTVTATPTPTIALSATALTFTVPQSGSNPANQTVTIANSGGGTLNWTASVTSGSWLSVSPPSGTGTATLTIAANIAGLSVSTYTGAIQVAAAGASNSPQTINVTLNFVAGPATISLRPSSLAFSAQAGGANPASQTVAISNSGGGTLNWTASVASGAWLSVSPPSGTGTATLTIAPSIAGLSAGSYSGAIQVAATGATNTPQTINVTLTITAPVPSPVIALNPPSLAFTAQQGGANPASQTVSLANAGGGTLDWTATVLSTSPWLTVSPTSGTGAATLTITANSAGLAPGTYSGPIYVAAIGVSNSPQILAVTFTVVQSAASAISLAPSSLQFIATAGTSPATQTFQVLNSFSSTLGWTATANTLVGSNWLSVSPTSGVSPSTLTVSVNSASLAKGIYLGNITITALSTANAINSPQSLLVALAVSAPMIGQNGIVDGAGFAPVVSSGAITSLFGTNLAAGTATAAVVPLPTVLAGTQVLVNGVPAPLFYVSPAQINFQMPAEPAGASVAVTVASGGITSLQATVDVAAAGPGIFTITSNGTGQGTVLNQDYSPNSAQNPAAAGSAIQIFATGLGLTNPSVPAGQPEPVSPLSMTVNTPVVTIAGVPALVLFSGLAPGFVGLYQVNVQVPPGTPSGSASLQIQINGQTSNSVTIAIR
jgi:uncharacterized protein (TIGR03437 family)